MQWETFVESQFRELLENQKTIISLLKEKKSEVKQVARFVDGVGIVLSEEAKETFKKCEQGLWNKHNKK